MLGTQEIEGVINASLNKTFSEPIQLQGVINAVVRRVGGGGDGQTGDGGGETETEAVEDLTEAVQNNYSTVEDLNTNIKELNDSVKQVTSGNLNPALGPTPAVDIPDVLGSLARTNRNRISNGAKAVSWIWGGTFRRKPVSTRRRWRQPWCSTGSCVEGSVSARSSNRHCQYRDRNHRNCTTDRANKC